MQTYDSYKDSGIDWVGEIPSHWEAIKIKNFFKTKSALFIDGDWIESKDIYGEDVYYFTTGNINELYFKDNERTYITEQTFNKLNCTAIAENDILVSRLNVPLCRCCLAPKFDKKSIVSVDVVIFRPDENYNRKYLVYIMNSPSYFQNTENIARGAIMKRISRTILGNIKLPIPPIQEQEAIARFLDDKCAKIDELVAIKEQQIDKLKELRQVKIHQAVTKGINPNAEMKDSGIDWIGEIPKHWEVKRLKFLTTNLNNRRIPIESTIRGKMVDCKYDYYGATGIIDKVEDYIFDEETILIAEDGANLLLRNIQLIYKPKGKYWVNNHAHILKPNSHNNLDFIAFSMENFDYTVYISGAAQPKLTKENLMNIWLVVPPLSEQEAIVAYLDEATNKIDQAIAQREAQIEKLKAYKQSLINEVVTGKIRVA